MIDEKNQPILDIEFCNNFILEASIFPKSSKVCFDQTASSMPIDSDILEIDFDKKDSVDYLFSTQHNSDFSINGDIGINIGYTKKETNDLLDKKQDKISLELDVKDFVNKEYIKKLLLDELERVNFTTDHTLTLKNNVLSVNTTDKVESDNTLPITSAAVETQIGNIEILLKTI